MFCPSPEPRGLLSQAGLRAVVRQKLRLMLNSIRKPLLKRFGNFRMQRTQRGSWPLAPTTSRIAAALLICGTIFVPGTVQALEKVSLQLKWLHQFQFAGYYVALEKGFYRDAGLDVEIRPGG